jgi:hypothetical protein
MSCFGRKLQEALAETREWDGGTRWDVSFIRYH